MEHKNPYTNARVGWRFPNYFQRESQKPPILICISQLLDVLPATHCEPIFCYDTGPSWMRWPVKLPGMPSRHTEADTPFLLMPGSTWIRHLFSLERRKKSGDCFTSKTARWSGEIPKG